MGKDLIDDAYGRFMEIPLGLATRGHAVEGLCLSYRSRAGGQFSFELDGAPVIWTSVNLSGFPPAGLVAYARTARRILAERRPDVLWACSDAFQVIIGAWLGGQSGVPCVADLYDNFESYRATRIPGILPLLRRALRRVAAVSCIRVLPPIRSAISNRIGLFAKAMTFAPNSGPTASAPKPNTPTPTTATFSPGRKWAL